MKTTSLTSPVVIGIIAEAVLVPSTDSAKEVKVSAVDPRGVRVTRAWSFLLLYGQESDAVALPSIETPGWGAERLSLKVTTAV